MKYYKITYLLLIALISVHLQAQQSEQMQTAHWYFGFNAGLDFSSGLPVVDINGQLYQLEGCTSISDENGNLLFYSDGRNVYNSAHNLMENGTGLRGDSSSTTSAIVLPKPDDCNLYYVFTIDCRDEEVPFWRPRRGIEYNVVDMSLNDGLGAVVEKNISIPINGIVQGYEKLAAISNADKTGYWVLTHFEGSFYAFEVTVDGVNLNPVTSPSAIFGGSQNIGYLKSSSDGSKLAMGMYSTFCTDRYLSVYDFNNSTGEVLNENILHQPGIGDLSNFYGIEFSPNNQLLYATNRKPKPFCSNGTNEENTLEIAQYNLLAPSIIDSKYVVTEVGYHGALELALDGKIYNNGGDKYIGRIENPNTVYNPETGEAPTYNPYAIDLNPYPEMVSGMGFPQFLNHYFRIAITVNDLSIQQDQLYCTGESLDFNFCSQGGEIQNVLWDFGDGVTSTEFYPQHVYNTPDIHTITLSLIVDGEAYTRTFEIEISGPPNIENATLSSCDNGESQTFNLSDALPQINPNGLEVDISFHPSEGDANNNENSIVDTHSVSSTTIIYVRAEDINACYVVRELTLVIYPLPLFNFQTPVETCIGTTASLAIDTANTNEVYWYSSEVDTVPVFTGNPFETQPITETTSYWVDVINEEGCISNREEIVVVVPEDLPNFSFDLSYCLNEVVEPLPTISDNGISGSWEPNIVNTSALGIQTYTFTAESSECGGIVQLSFDIEVLDLTVPEFTIETQYLLGDTPAQLPNTSNNGISGSWYPSIISPSGNHNNIYVFSPNENQCAETFMVEIEVMGYPMFFTPNDDSYNDYWNISGFRQEHQAEIQIFDRYGKLIKLLKAPGVGWDGTYNGKKMPTNDYWFRVVYNMPLQDGSFMVKEFKAHFALKR